MNMKIEKLSDNQIRCTLTRADLAERQLQLSELAYGTEKAKSLFRDMMQQAAFEFGFEAEDIPLMIEAIPSSDSIVLIITKVEDPEELDTRFSKFAPSSPGERDSRKKDSPGKLNGADSLLELLDKVKEKFDAAPAGAAETKKEEEKAVKMLTELYVYYFDHPEAMSEEYQELIRRGEKLSQVVCDYLSGMTDQYSMEKFREIYIPRAWEVY